MARFGYLDWLDGSLRHGCRELPDAFVRRHMDYVRCCQNPDGGFPGPRGDSDLYYTEFALRALNLGEGADDGETWRRAADYLRSFDRTPDDIVECFCVLHSAEMLRYRGESVAMPDAYPKGDAPGLYGAFLAALCHQLLGEEMPDMEATARGVLNRQGEDGGFRDRQADCCAAGGVNPTAAAIGLLTMAGSLDSQAASSAADFITGLQAEDGGFLAHADAPGSDLMSTFTALVSLQALGALRKARLSDAGRYAQSLSEPEGGFRGARTATAPDVEYTFYGLGTLSLLALAAAGRRSCACACQVEGTCCE